MVAIATIPKEIFFKYKKYMDGRVMWKDSKREGFVDIKQVQPDEEVEKIMEAFFLLMKGEEDYNQNIKNK